MFWKIGAASKSKIIGEEAQPFEVSQVVEPSETSKAVDKLNASILCQENVLANAPKWVEIEGYKAVQFDMTAFHGKEKYLLGETKNYDGILSPCESGYHFGSTLRETINHYPPRFGTRYFKVKGLVPAYNYVDGDGRLHTCPKTCGRMMWESEFIKYRKERQSYMYRPEFSDFSCHGWKFVAKEITFIEEIPFEEIASIEPVFTKLIETKEEYYQATGWDSLTALAMDKWNNTAKETFSEGFNTYMFHKVVKKLGPNKITRAYVTLTQSLAAVREEKISQDMRVALFLQFLEDEIGK